MEWIKLLIPMAFFLALNGGMAVLVRRKFGELLPVTLCVSGFALYASQYLLGSYSPGFWLLTALAAASVALLLAAARAKPERLRFALSPGTVAFIVLYLFACAILIGKDFYDWDEYTHWGMMVKESLRLDRFHCVTETRLKWHRDYPPFAAMIEVLWCRLCGGYNEGRVTVAMQVLTMSFVLPWLQERVWRIGGDKPLSRSNWGAALVQSVCLEIVVLMLDFSLDRWSQRIVNSILPDTALSFALAYLMLILIDGELDWFAAVAVAVVGAAMLSIKQVGVAFTALAAFMALLAGVIPGGDKKRARALPLKLLVIVAAPAAAYVSWALYKGRYISNTDFSYMYGQFNLRQIDIAEYIRSAMGRGQGNHTQTLISYLEALFTKPLNNVDALPVTYASSLLICALALMAMRGFFRALFSRRQAILLGAGCAAGTLGYAFMMSVMYLFCFNEGEQEKLAGYTRYMSSYVMAEALVLGALLLCLALKRFGAGRAERSRRASLGRWVAGALVAVIVLNPANLYHMVNRRVAGDPYASYREHADRVRALVPADSKVFIICDMARTINKKWWDPMQLFVQYYASELDIDFNYNNSYALDYGDPNVRQAVFDEITACDYLYVAHTCEAVDAAFSGCMGGGAFDEGGVYRVEIDENGLALIPVEA